MNWDKITKFIYGIDILDDYRRQEAHKISHRLYVLQLGITLLSLYIGLLLANIFSYKTGLFTAAILWLIGTLVTTIAAGSIVRKKELDTTYVRSDEYDHQRKKGLTYSIKTAAWIASIIIIGYMLYYLTAGYSFLVILQKTIISSGIIGTFLGTSMGLYMRKINSIHVDDDE